MTAVRRTDPPPAPTTDNGSVLVWIDAKEAILVRWGGDEATIDRVRSDVPGRRRSTGHVRHDPGIRHGGGGTPQSAGEPRRLEHLRRFVGEVTTRIQPDENVLILGPGTVRNLLEVSLHETDGPVPGERLVTSEAAARRTDPQLVARLRELIGDEPPRRKFGALGD